MVRALLSLVLLAGVAGCGEAPSAHRVTRSADLRTAPPASADAATRPPRAIATH